MIQCCFRSINPAFAFTFSTQFWWQVIQRRAGVMESFGRTIASKLIAEGVDWQCDIAIERAGHCQPFGIRRCAGVLCEPISSNGSIIEDGDNELLLTQRPFWVQPAMFGFALPCGVFAKFKLHLIDNWQLSKNSDGFSKRKYWDLWLWTLLTSNQCLSLSGLEARQSLHGRCSALRAGPCCPRKMHWCQRFQQRLALCSVSDWWGQKDGDLSARWSALAMEQGEWQPEFVESRCM